MNNTNVLVKLSGSLSSGREIHITYSYMNIIYVAIFRTEEVHIIYDYQSDQLIVNPEYEVRI
jgi:hypothetical protein